MAGCTSAPPTQDSYIELMMGDPMFSWTPPSHVVRQVSYKVRESGSRGSGQSYITITLTPDHHSDVPGLQRAAGAAIEQAGYTVLLPDWDGKRLVGQLGGRDVWMECMIEPDYPKIFGWPTSETYGVLNLVLTAPLTV